MSENFVVIETVSGNIEAEIIRGMLEAKGIDAVLRGESAATAIGLTVGPIADVEILVPKDQEVFARQVIQDYYSGALDTDEEVEEEGD
jgi:hypothetical protein